MQSPPFPRYLVPPRSKCSPQHHVLKCPQLPFLPQCQCQVSHPYKTTGKTIVLYILILLLTNRKITYISLSIKFQRLQWAGHIVRTDNTKYKKKEMLSGRTSYMKTCGKTMTDERTAPGGSACCC